MNKALEPVDGNKQYIGTGSNETTATEARSRLLRQHTLNALEEFSICDSVVQAQLVKIKPFINTFIACGSSSPTYEIGVYTRRSPLRHQHLQLILRRKFIRSFVPRYILRIQSRTRQIPQAPRAKAAQV